MKVQKEIWKKAKENFILFTILCEAGLCGYILNRNIPGDFKIRKMQRTTIDIHPKICAVCSSGFSFIPLFSLVNKGVLINETSK